MSNRPEWIALCQRDKHGKPIANLFNVRTALRHDPKLAQFAFDEMQADVVVKRPDGTFEPFTDVHVSDAQTHLQQCGMTRVGRDDVYRGIEREARERPFHPVRDAIKAAVWDGKERLERWTVDYLGAEDTPYNRQVGRIMLLQAVARVFNPGCQADVMVVLEGPQGVGKSTVVKILAGSPDHYTDALPDIGRTKESDLSQHMRGKWFVELGELQAMGRTDDRQLKSFLSRTTEKYRPAYARRQVTEPRQCVIVGSTNESQYLRDATGARRYFPLRVGRIDLDALQRDRTQLFGEAYARLVLQGAQWWPDAALMSAHAIEIDDRFEDEPQTDAVREYLEQYRPDRIKPMELAQRAMGVEPGEFRKEAQSSLTKIMRRLKWESKRSNGARYYLKPKGWGVPPVACPNVTPIRKSVQEKWEEQKRASGDPVGDPVGGT